MPRLSEAVAVATMMLLGATLPAVTTSRRLQGADSQRTLNLVGEIMDSRCAIDGLHDKMMRENGTKNAKDCTLQCAKTGGSFVLIDPETKSVYQLDDQQKPARFAGQRLAGPLWKGGRRAAPVRGFESHSPDWI